MHLLLLSRSKYESDVFPDTLSFMSYEIKMQGTFCDLRNQIT